jgi:hypothetical protein
MTMVNVAHSAALVGRKPNRDLRGENAKHGAGSQKERDLSLCLGEPRAGESEPLSSGIGRLPQPSAILKVHLPLLRSFEPRARHLQTVQASENLGEESDSAHLPQMPVAQCENHAILHRTPLT